MPTAAITDIFFHKIIQQKFTFSLYFANCNKTSRSCCYSLHYRKKNIHVIKKQWGNGAMGKLHQTPPLPTVTALKQEMYGVAKVS